MKNFILLFLFFNLIFSIFIPTQADPNQTTPTTQLFPAGSTYQVCFTPDQNCTQEIIDLIHSAKSQIRMQIYSFTSKPIARALVQAKKSGIDVEIIYDHSDADNFNNKNFSLQPYLTKNHIPGFIDPIPGIAHNKVIIIDGEIIETGSFNYTKSAQDNNAENILIINSKPLAQAYLNNWNARRQESTAI